MTQPPELAQPFDLINASHTVVRYLDTDDTAQQIRALKHPSLQVADPPGKVKRTADVQRAILYGRGTEVLSTKKKVPVDAVAAAWLIADGITDVVVCDAMMIGPERLVDVADWLTMNGIRGWFAFPFPASDAEREAAGDLSPLDPADVADDPMNSKTSRHLMGEYHNRIAERSTLLIDGYNAREATLDDLAAQCVEPDESDPAGPSGLPDVPWADAIRFRHAAAASLGPGEFQQVDDFMKAQIREQIDEQNNLGPTMPSRTLRRRLAGRIDQAADTNELICIVRAAQIAGYHTGFHITVKTDALLAAAAVFPRQGKAINRNWYRELRRLPEPMYGAAVALSLAGIDETEMTALQLQDIDPQTGEVNVNGTPTAISPQPASLIRVQRVFRELCGAKPDDNLFITHTQKPATVNYIRGLLYDPTLELGIDLSPNRRIGSRTDTKRALNRYGININKTRKDAKQ